jgi:hypothetical protein
MSDGAGPLRWFPRLERGNEDTGWSCAQYSDIANPVCPLPAQIDHYEYYDLAVENIFIDNGDAGTASFRGYHNHTGADGAIRSDQACCRGSKKPGGSGSSARIMDDRSCAIGRRIAILPASSANAEVLSCRGV